MARKKKPVVEETVDDYIPSDEELAEFNNPTREENKLLPSHWAQEYGVDPHLFLWWDTNEGVVSRKRFEELRKQQGA